MLLEVQSLSCGIGQKQIFSGVSFGVNPGELVSIEGGSGRGKSSLLFGIRGISHEEKVYAGRVLFKGSPLNAAVRQHIGLVLQNPHSQMISTLVREELMFGVEESQARATSINQRFQCTVDLLGLEAVLDKPVRTLSSGQKHLVAIGAAGMMPFELLLMDEPFLYLDPGNISKVLDYMSYLRNKGAGVVLTSHPGIISSRQVDRVVPIESSEPMPPLPVVSISPDSPSVLPGQRRVHLHRVGYGYEGSPLLAVDLSFTLTGGKELWIEGANGSGKTTLLHILSGDREPDRGLVERTGAGGACRVMTLTQNPDRHFFEPTVQREMASALMGKKRDFDKLEAAEDEIEALLTGVGLAHKTHVSPFKLSFGEKIHLAAAQAVLLRPDFIFVDDILGFLEGRERRELLIFLRRAMERIHCGVIFTSSRGIYAYDAHDQIIRLSDYLPFPEEKATAGSLASDKNPLMTDKTKNGSNLIQTPKKARQKRGVVKRLFRTFKAPAYDYVAGASPLHRASPLVKMGINMGIWFLIYALGVESYPLLALVLFLYYLLSGMGVGRFIADSRFFAIQALVFALFMPIFRWDVAAAGEGALAGVRVWLFFVPVMVMMRTTTVGEWMALFSRFLSRDKKLAMGIAFGLLPCITADAREILRIQGQKGLVPDKKDLLHPGQLFVGLKAVFIPLLILMEDIATLAGLSVKLKGMEE
ncbi:ATP-binding cassette domain-containing protein [Desulfocicer niacini]